MCGRYSLAKAQTMIEKRFQVVMERGRFSERYNAAPTQDMPVITNEEPGKAVFYRWGLIPFWARESSIGNRLINARAETIAEKPAFSKSASSERCLVIADGFYEWKQSTKGKFPYRIVVKDGELFAFAGLWDRWKTDSGKEIRTFAIITVAANPLVGKIHDRMPAILLPDDEKKWLGNLTLPELLKLLRPYPEKMMKAYPISRAINSPANDSPDVIAPSKEIF
jgi:putative SOS response-associated peptidase YedK